MTELRKANGMREREPGVWELYVDAGRDVLTGKRRRISRTFRGNQRDAVKARAKLVTEVGGGRHDGTNARLDDLFPEWIRELKRLGRSPSTITTYTHHYEHDIRPTLGTTPVTKVTTKILTDLYAAHQDRGLSPGSVYQIHAAISSMMSQACRWGWRDSNPAQWASRPAIRRRRPTAPTPQEVMKLVDAARRSRRPEYATLFFVAATTGLRRSELCGLRVRRNIDFEAAELSVTHVIIKPPGEPLIEKEGPKNQEDRSLALDRATLSLMASNLDMMKHRAATIGAELIDDPFLFSNEPDGSVPWRPGSISQYFGRLRVEVGLDNLKFKHLRSFMDTYGQEAGFSLAQVALRAGHDPAVASKHYTARVTETDRRLAEALADYLTIDVANTSDAQSAAE